MNLEEKNTISSFIEYDSKPAFTILFQKYSDKIYNLAIHYYNSPGEAEEIVQEVFLKVWIKRKSIKTPEAFWSFLYQTAKNMIFDSFRKQIHIKAYSEYLRLSDFKTQTKNTEETILYRDLNNYYQQLIETMPAKRKEVFLLCNQQGLNHQEIADRMDISIRTVEEHMRQAVNYLRKLIKNRYQEVLILVFPMGVEWVLNLFIR